MGGLRHSAATLLPCLASLGHLTGGYVAPPSATPKFALLTLRTLHIYPKRYNKLHHQQ